MTELQLQCRELAIQGNSLIVCFVEIAGLKSFSGSRNMEANKYCQGELWGWTPLPFGSDIFTHLFTEHKVKQKKKEEKRHEQINIIFRQWLFK